MELQAQFDLIRAASRSSTPDYRVRVDGLRRLERVLVQRKSEIITAISEDFGGRAAEETLALELFPLLTELRHTVRHLRGWMQPRRADVPWPFWPARAKVVYQPLGVVGILSAWNYPLFLTLTPLVGAVAAGNRVLMKPSELAPCTAELMKSMIGDIYSADYVAVVNGDAEVARAFASLPFDHLLFTGSTRVGKLVMKAASENLTPVTLELGGKSPAVIHPDYPFRKAVERTIGGKLYNAGQTCVAPDYVVVVGRNGRDFVSTAQNIVASMFPRLVQNEDYTRILNVQQYRRLTGMVNEARERGAEVFTVNPALEDCNEANRVFPPTLVLNAPDDSAVMREEIFGPVLPVVDCESLEEAIQFVKARPRPLALYYFDTDRRRVDRVLQETSSGGVTVNDCVIHVGIPDLPFGGIGPSGMGQYHGFDGFLTFSKKRGVVVQGRWASSSVLRPPYGEKARRVLRLLIGG